MVLEGAFRFSGLSKRMHGAPIYRGRKHRKKTGFWGEIMNLVLDMLEDL